MCENVLFFARDTYVPKRLQSMILARIAALSHLRSGSSSEEHATV